MRLRVSDRAMVELEEGSGPARVKKQEPRWLKVAVNMVVVPMVAATSVLMAGVVCRLITAVWGIGFQVAGWMIGQ